METKSSPPWGGDWIYYQSAAVPFRCREGQLELLLITSRGKKRWIVPKGIVDPGLTPSAAAAKEAFEEAGVEGEILYPSVGTYTYPKWQGTCTVEVFLLRTWST